MNAEPITTVGFQFANYALPTLPDYQLFDHTAEVARRAEAAGFDSLWVMDHLHQIPSVGANDEPVLEAFTALAALAEATRTAKVGTLVTPEGLRSPALVAKMMTTIDVISHGRAVLGLGAGWFEEEFVAYDRPFPSLTLRFDRLEEAAQICRKMFDNASTRYTGVHHIVRDAVNAPGPTNPGGVPILIGGGGEKRTIPLVAQYADAANFVGGPLAVERKIAILKHECESRGRDPESITITWLGTAILCDDAKELRRSVERLARLLDMSPDATRAFALCGSSDEIAEQSRAYRDVGVDGVIVSMDDTTRLDDIATLGRALGEGMG